MIIYVAIPFSHPDEHIRNERFEMANKYAARLMLQGRIVFSPISHSVPISKHIGNPNDSDFYVKQDLFWLKYCNEMHVLMINGWETSKGIKKETDFALGNDINIKYITLEDIRTPAQMKP